MRKGDVNHTISKCDKITNANFNKIRLQCNKINKTLNSLMKKIKYKPKDKYELIDLIFNQNIKLNKIDVSNITDMSDLFKDCKQTKRFFKGIEEWDVSNITNMEYMFEICKKFKQDISRSPLLLLIVGLKVWLSFFIISYFFFRRRIFREQKLSTLLL